jgi:uncharacterized membrane protein YjjB (DUF3815 family)
VRVAVPAVVPLVPGLGQVTARAGP